MSALRRFPNEPRPNRKSIGRSGIARRHDFFDTGLGATNRVGRAFSRWRGGGFAPWGFHVEYKSLRSRRLYREPDDNSAVRAGLLVRESYCILPCTGDPRASTASKCSHCFPRPCGFLMTKSDYFSSPTNIHKFRALVTVSPKRVGLRGAEAKSELGFESAERRSALGGEQPGRVVGGVVSSVARTFRVSRKSLCSVSLRVCRRNGCVLFSAFSSKTGECRGVDRGL